MSTVMVAREVSLHGSDTPPSNSRRPQRANGAAADQSYLAVIVTSPAACDKANFEEWQAELRLVEASRSLPLAWPLRQWLDDYHDLLATAFGATAKRTAPAVPRTEEIREFLRLILVGRDRSAAELIRTLTGPHPFADELRRFRRVQALFATLRPARSLAEALDFRIVTRRAAR